MFGNRRVDHAPRAEFLQKTLCDLICALIFGDFFAHHKDRFIGAHFFGHCIAQSLAHSHCNHRRSGWNLSRGRRSGNSRRHGHFRASLHGVGGFWSRRGNRHRIGAFTFCGNDRNRRVDCDIFRAVCDQDLSEHALIDRFDFHRRLVGLDLGEHIAGLDLVADLLDPFGKFALFHRG